MSTYTLHEAATREELDAIIDVVWEAMPGADPSHSVSYPILSTSTEARTATICDLKERAWKDHSENSTSHWIYILAHRSSDSPDSAGVSSVVAGCQWRIYESNPFEHGVPTITATWWPDGAGRAFATEVVRQCFEPRTLWMARPHTGLSQMAVLPSHQRRGLGTRLMQWGLTKTDELGLESFIEASGQGKGLYMKCGYRPVAIVEVDTHKLASGRTEEWAVYEKECLPIGYTATWRPRNGDWSKVDLEAVWRDRMGI